MFCEYLLLALCLALFPAAQAKPTFTGRYAIYNTPGPVIPSFPPGFPFKNLSNNATKAAVVIRHDKLEDFCKETFLKKYHGKKDEGGHKAEFDNSQLNRRQSNFNINSNYNSNLGNGYSYSSSYSNSNGHISQVQSGSPGANGKMYYNFATNGGKSRNSGSSSRSYLINGVKIPEALHGFSPKAIIRGCELAKKRGKEE